jgi:hypothetical protein
VQAIPRTDVVCAGDPADPVVAPGTPGWEVCTLASGHWPMITKPTELAEVLHQAARP